MSKLAIEAFSDIDGTMSEGIMLFPITAMLADEGIIDRRDQIEIQASYDAFLADKADYGTMAVTAILAFNRAVTGLREDRLSDVVHSHLRDISFFEWVEPTFAKLQEHGSLTLVSAEPAVITSEIANAYGASFLSSHLPIDSGGFFTGEQPHLLGSAEKGQQVASKIISTQPDQVFVFGDSAGDRGMLELAMPQENAYCIRPDLELRPVAERLGMTIVDDPHQAQSLVTL